MRFLTADTAVAPASETGGAPGRYFLFMAWNLSLILRHAAMNSGS
jgi:hypothetical protein